MKLEDPVGTTEAGRYTLTAIVLHWLIGIAVFAQIGLGLWMIGIPKSPPGVRAYWFNVHKSIGITIALLVLGGLLLFVATGRRLVQMNAAGAS